MYYDCHENKNKMLINLAYKVDKIKENEGFKSLQKQNQIFSLFYNSWDI